MSRREFEILLSHFDMLNILEARIAARKEKSILVWDKSCPYCSSTGCVHDDWLHSSAYSEEVRYKFPLDVDNGNFVYNDGPYTVRWSISDHTTKSKRIKVMVTWKRWNQHRTITVAGLFSDQMRDPRSWDATDWEAWKAKFGVTGIN